MKSLSRALFALSILCPTSLWLAPLRTQAEEPPPLKIGVIYSLTGWGALGGLTENVATRIAVEEINAAGGVRGRKIELVTEDNQSDFKKVATAIQKLASIDKVPVILGPNWAEFTEIAAPISQNRGVVLLSSSGYSPTLTQGRPFVFSALPSHSAFTEPLARQIAKDGRRSIEILTSENGYCNSITKALSAQLTQEGVAITNTQSFSHEETDFRSIILKLKRSKADAIFLSLLEGVSLGTFLRQAKELELASPLYGINSILYDEAVRKNPSLADGVTFFQGIVYSTPGFEKKYRSLTDIPIFDTAPRAYDSVYLLRNAIERCGFEPREIARCLEEVSHTGLTGEFRFDKNHYRIPAGPVTDVLIGRNGVFERVNP